MSEQLYPEGWDGQDRTPPPRAIPAPMFRHPDAHYPISNPPPFPRRQPYADTTETSEFDPAKDEE